MKGELRALFEETLGELSIGRALETRLRCEDGVLAVGDERIVLADYKKIVVAAIGKAAHGMAREFARLVAPARVS